MRGDMGDMASPQGRGRQRDRTDVFADESQALDEIAKQVRRNPVSIEMYELKELFLMIRGLCNACLSQKDKTYCFVKYAKPILI